MLQPVKDGRKRKFQELNFQLTALAHVEFRWRSGQETKEQAEEPPEAFGVSSETLHTWERCVPEGLGRLKVDQTLAHAAAHAAAFRQAEELQDRADAEKFFAERIYGDVASDRDGKEYKRYRERVGASKQTQNSVGGSKRHTV